MVQAARRRVRRAPPSAADKLALVRVDSREPGELDPSFWCRCEEGCEGDLDPAHLSEDLWFDDECARLDSSSLILAGTASQAREHLQNMLEIVDEVKRGADGGIPLDLLLVPLNPVDVLRAGAKEPPRPPRHVSASLEAKFARLRGYMSICDVIVSICRHIGRLELALEYLTFLADAVRRPEYRSPLCGQTCASPAQRPSI